MCPGINQGITPDFTPSTLKDTRLQALACRPHSGRERAVPCGALHMPVLKLVLKLLLKLVDDGAQGEDVEVDLCWVCVDVSLLPHSRRREREAREREEREGKGEVGGGK